MYTSNHARMIIPWLINNPEVLLFFFLVLNKKKCFDLIYYRFISREKEREWWKFIWIGKRFDWNSITKSCCFVCLERYHDLDRRCREYEYSNNELKQLNAQLEKDLLSVGGVSELFRRGPEVDWSVRKSQIRIQF